MFDRSSTTIDDREVAWDSDLLERIACARNGRRTETEIPISIRDARRVLRSWQRESTIFYWAARGHGEVAVAAGVADSVTARGPLTAAQVREALREVERRAVGDIRYYGGMRFDPSIVGANEWAAYQSVYFFRPRYEVRLTRSRATLRIDPSVGAELAADTERWTFDDDARPRAFAGIVRNGALPDRPEWIRGVEQTLAHIRSGHLEKAVLARAVDVYGGADVDAVALLDLVVDAAPSCYHVLFRPESGTAFVCATPERLIGRRGNRIVSEAVAGTRPRSVSLEDDTRLRDELLASDKDRREHEVVGRSIVEALAPFSSHVDIEKQPSEMRLATGRHLKSAIRADLLPDVATADLVAAVHPTPAVGGYPTPEALALLRETERFDRGWYAGAVGWIGNDQADLAVGIRSALVQANRVRLFSGAGIVDGSEPVSEWDEIEQKLDGFLKVLRIAP